MNTRTPREKAILVSIQTQDMTDTDVDYSLEELAELAKTANIDTVGTVVQKRAQIDRNSYLGKGKMSEVGKKVIEAGANLVITDDELSGLQIRRMEEGIEAPVTDRTSLILDIFSMHATSKEGKLQVELAQMQYRLLRLAGGYVGLSRQRGGIGTKGPGETKIESDRRVLRDRIHDLNQTLEKIVQDREVQRKKRTEKYAPLFALVGYTNAGKSTLLNALSGSQNLVCDGLFTTLEPTARRIDLASGRCAILSDTVGFIKKLPHGLIRAFRATLEDVVNAQVIMIVCDISNPQFREQIVAVREVLKEIGALDHSHLLVFNKTDKPIPHNLDVVKHEYPDAQFISSKTGDGLDDLKMKMDRIVAADFGRLKLSVPSKDPILKEIFNLFRVQKQEWNEDNVLLEVELPKKYFSRVEAYRIK